MMGAGWTEVVAMVAAFAIAVAGGSILSPVLAGAYTGARISGRLPEALIRRLIGVLVIAIGARYLCRG